jgi:hypothetical protein
VATIAAPFYVDLTRVAEPQPYGLLSVAHVVDDASPHWRAGVDTVSDACITAAEAPDPCDPAVQKDITNAIAISSLVPFAIYALNACKTVGSIDEARGRTERSFARAEGPAVESGFMRSVLADSGQVTDLSPGNTFSAADGIAMLEGYAARTYGGVATLHVPRSITSKVAQPLAWQRAGDHIETFQGNLVASGGGYEDNLGPDGTEAPAGSAWVYITGVVTLYRSPADVIGPLVDTTNNDFMVLIERVYGPIIDCMGAAVLVSTGCCSCETP